MIAGITSMLSLLQASTLRYPLMISNPPSLSHTTIGEITPLSDMLSKIADNLSPSGISEREVIDIMKKRNGDDKNV